MISWKNGLAEFESCCPTVIGLSGLSLVPPKLGAVGDQSELSVRVTVLIFVDQLRQLQAKEPPHLVAEPGPVAAALLPPLRVWKSSFRMNPDSERTQDTSSRLWVRTASVQTQASNRRGKVTEGEFVLRRQQSLPTFVRSVLTRLVLKPVAGVGARQAAQRHQPCHEAQSRGLLRWPRN